MITAKWDITSKCNLRCSHCSVADMYFEGAHYPGLSVKERLHVIDNLASGGVTHLSLLGGEPLALKEQLYTLIERAKRHGLKISLVTNGTLLSREVSQRLISGGLDRLVVSIEGAGREIHDQIRGEGTFDTLMRNLHDFLSLKTRQSSQSPNLTVNTVLTRQNLNGFSGMISFCRDLGADEWNALSLNFVGNAKKRLESIAVAKHEHTTAAFEIGKTLCAPGFNRGKLDINLQMTYPLVWEYLCKKFDLLLPQPQVCCSASTSLVYISPNGDLHICDRVHGDEYADCLIEGVKIHPVSLLTHDFQSIWNSQQYLKMYKLVKNPETYKLFDPCNRCKYLFRGVCNPCPLYSFSGKKVRFEECLKAEKYLGDIRIFDDDNRTSWEKSFQLVRLQLPFFDPDTYEKMKKMVPVSVPGTRQSIDRDGSVLLMNARSRESIKLNEFGSQIWKSTTGLLTIENLLMEASGIYRELSLALDVNTSTAHCDAFAKEFTFPFIQLLHEKGFIEYKDSL